jgi:prolactin regulatory element-binding protein
LASAVAFYIFFQKSDSFWNVPPGRDQPGKQFEILDPQYSEDAFGPVDM